MSAMIGQTRGLLVASLCCMILSWCVVFDVSAVSPAMKGPKSLSQGSPPDDGGQTSSVVITFSKAIQIYQQKISPFRYGECGFRPSCSRYGYMAIREEGPFTGLMMTGDRLIRCNVFKKSGPDYMFLPGIGKLYDPPSKNLLFQE